MSIYEWTILDDYAHQNPECHQRTEHVDVRWHYIRREEILQIEYTPMQRFYTSCKSWVANTVNLPKRNILAASYLHFVVFDVKDHLVVFFRLALRENFLLGHIDKQAPLRSAVKILQAFTLIVSNHKDTKGRVTMRSVSKPKLAGPDRMQFSGQRLQEAIFRSRTL